MDKIAEELKTYIDTHPLDLGEGDCETVLDQLYQAYAESHESDPPEISEGFKELEELEEFKLTSVQTVEEQKEKL